MVDREGEADVEAEAEAAGAGAGEGATGAEAGSEVASADEGAGAAGEPEVEYVELVKIHNVATVQEARLIKGLLESADVPCVVEDDVMETLHGFIPSQLDGIDILVPATFGERAKELLCTEGIVCGVDPKAVALFIEEKVKPAFGGDEAAVAVLHEALSRQNRDFRHDVVGRLARAGEPGFELARALVVRACESAADPGATPEESVEESRGPVHVDVARLVDEGRLGPKGPPALVLDLARLAADERPVVRRCAAAALGRIRGAGAGKALVALLDDADGTVRDEALESLYTLSSGETFGYDPDREPAKQHEAIANWREWVREHPAA